MLTLILRPLLRLASSPTVAATAASWSINTMAGHVRELEASKTELDMAITDRQQYLAELDDAIAAARVEVVETSDAAAAAEDLEAEEVTGT